MQGHAMLSKEDQVDRFLASCVRAALNGGEPPAWPAGFAKETQAVSERLAFHGISLLLIESRVWLGSWPEAVVASMRAEARLQAMWEADHAEAIGRLLAAFTDDGVVAVVMKGTALAYSAYSDPAQRRRGDTDLLVEGETRRRVRHVLRSCEFEPTGDRQALQETWTLRGAAGFSHAVDIHWSISASAAIAFAYERDHPRKRLMPLPRLAPHAQSTGPLDCFVQVCVNRLAHAGFGYWVDGDRVYGGDRLIWAVDLYLLAMGFDEADWERLSQIASSCGASRAVASGIVRVRETFGLAVPDRVIRALETQEPEADTSHKYYARSSALERMRMDLAASRSLAEKSAVLSHHLFPGREVMAQRYPGSGGLPLPFLHLRRLLDAGMRMLLGGSR